MSENSFTVTSSKGWFGRIGESIKGILFGLLLIVISFPVLFMNEGRAVKTRKTLDEGAKSVLSVSSETVSAANEGKLVHLTGKTAAEGVLTDPEFGVSAAALKLLRKVEMFQWVEKTETKTEKKLGGGEETVTTYTYTKEWNDRAVDSSQFKKPQGHENPKPAVDGRAWSAKPITLGAFSLSDSLIAQIRNFTLLSGAGPVEQLEEIAGKKVHREANGLFLGADPAAPVVGDLRVRHEVALPGEVSVVARQIGNTFEPFVAKAGGSIEMLAEGTKSADSMFAAAQASNRMLTWGLRLLGVILMFFGFSLIFRPLSVLADLLPIAGTIVGVGTGFVAFLLTLPISLMVISVAWIFYRPLLGIPLAILAVAGFVLLGRKLIAERRRQAGVAVGV